MDAGQSLVEEVGRAGGLEERGEIICLVVEDEPAILRLVSLVLQDLGLDVVVASDAETALDMVYSRRPDIVLADVQLPGMDGIELARRLKLDPALARTPVLLMSAYGEPPDHQGDGFLPKPFNPEELTDFLRSYLAH
ncbi:MAG TPA: response regulator [Dehalococcoidia bacterium]|nr:response regulator [Dehalococcoidia bacterium]